jgi:site-specific recombinase XerD
MSPSKDSTAVIDQPTEILLADDPGSSGLRLFARWFEQTTGEAFTPQAVTPTDVRAYRQHLLTVDRRKASTVNRKLAALTVFMTFAIEARLIEHDPTAAIKHVEESPRGPRHLDRQQQFALQRAIEQDLQYSQRGIRSAGCRADET